MTDESLLIRQLHDEATRHAAFTQVVEAYKERLYWQVRRLVLRHEDADDVLQNTFLKAWQGLDGFRGESQLSTWLFRIAQNEALSFLDRQRRLQDHSLDAPSLPEGRSVASQLESDPYFDGDETERQLQEAIAALPERQRQVFLLKYYDEMKYEEMSRLLQTSVGALKASYHHAVRKISDFFAAKE